MDQSVLENIRWVYRNELLTTILAEEYDIYILADAHDRVSENCVKQSWATLWPVACLQDALIFNKL